MSYIQSAYNDEDHFTCERVLEFRKRVEAAFAEPTTAQLAVAAKGSPEEGDSVKELVATQ